MSDTPANPTPPLAPIPAGVSGLNQTAGRVWEEQHPRLSGDRFFKVYREIDETDAVVGTGRNIHLRFARRVKWRVVEAKAEKGGRPDRIKEAAKFLEECLGDMRGNMGDLISEAFTMYPYGFAPVEICYKRRLGPHPGKVAWDGRAVELPPSKFDDGRVGWDAFSLRAQRSREHWDINDATGEINGMWQLAPPDWRRRYIPMEKMLFFRTESILNNPEGRSMYKNLERSYYIKKRVEEFEAIIHRRDATGFPDMQVPPNIANPQTAEEATAKASYERQLALIGADGLAYMLRPSEVDADGKPTGYKYGVIQSAGTGRLQPDVTIRRHEGRMAMVLQIEHVLLGLDAHGSYSMHSDKTALAAMAIDASLGIVQDIFNEQAVARLMKLNGFEPEVWPTYERGDLEKPEIDKLAAAMEILTRSGHLTPGDKKTETHLRQVLDVPELPETAAPGNPMLPAPAASGAAVPPPGGALASTQPGGAGGQTSSQTAETVEAENFNTISLAIQRLATARREAMAAAIASDNAGNADDGKVERALAEMMRDKLETLLSRI